MSLLYNYCLFLVLNMYPSYWMGGRMDGQTNERRDGWMNYVRLSLLPTYYDTLDTPFVE